MSENEAEVQAQLSEGIAVLPQRLGFHIVRRISASHPAHGNGTLRPCRLAQSNNGHTSENFCIRAGLTSRSRLSLGHHSWPSTIAAPATPTPPQRPSGFHQ